MTDTELTPVAAARANQCARVLALMAEGKTQKAACEEVGMTERQFHYWVDKQGGMTEVIELAHKLTVNAALAALHALPKAVERLVHHATSEKTAPRDQIAAIRELRMMVSEVSTFRKDDDGTQPQGEELAKEWVPSWLKGAQVDVTVRPQVTQIIEAQVTRPD